MLYHTADCHELKPVVGSERSDDFRRNDLLIDVGQLDLKYNQFASLKGIGHESSQATLTRAPNLADLAPALLSASEISIRASKRCLGQISGAGLAIGLTG
jgi:hypothetical protein